MLRTRFYVSARPQLLSVPCYREGESAAPCVSACCWLVPRWVLLGTPVAQCHLWAAGWCEAAQGHRTTTAPCPAQRACPLPLWVTSGRHSAQEVQPSEGEWLTDCSRWTVLQPPALTAWFLNNTCWDLFPKPCFKVFLKGTPSPELSGASSQLNIWSPRLSIQTLYSQYHFISGLARLLWSWMVNLFSLQGSSSMKQTLACLCFLPQTFMSLQAPWAVLSGISD